MNPGLLNDLLDRAKEQFAFPPKSFLKGFLQHPSRPAGLAQPQVAEGTALYTLDCIGEVLNEFTDSVLNNLDALGLNNDNEIYDQIGKTLDAVTTETRALLVREFSSSWEQLRVPALSSLDDGKGKLLDQLHRKIRLRKLKFGGNAMSSIHVTGSQNVSVVLGAVNTSIQQIIQRGGVDKEAADIIRELLEVVQRLGSGHEAEKAELVRLTKGLVRELEQPESERNPSTMLAILEKIKKVGLAIAGAGELARFFTERFPELLRLLGLGS